MEINEKHTVYVNRQLYKQVNNKQTYINRQKKRETFKEQGIPHENIRLAY